jgi:hypothetical protein
MRIFRSLFLVSLFFLLSKKAFSQNSDSIINALQKQCDILNASLDVEKKSAATIGGERDQHLREYNSLKDQYSRDTLARNFNLQQIIAHYDDQLKITKANFYKDSTELALTSNRLNLITLQLAQENALGSVAKQSYDIAIKSAQEQIRKGKNDSITASKRFLNLKAKVSKEARLYESVRDSLTARIQYDTIRLRQTRDSIINIRKQMGEELDSAKVQLAITQNQLKEMNAHSFTEGALVIMLSGIVIYAFIFFFFKTKTIIKEAKSLHKAEENPIIKDTLIRYHYYNKVVYFSQSLLYLSIGMSIIYGIILLLIVMNTNNVGASLKELLEKDSISTLGTLATPLIFSIALYNFIESKIQDNARLISDLRKS